MDKKLAIVVSHPIQYYAPLFRELAKQVNLIVFYCHKPTDEEVGKDGFGKKFNWDVDLLNGYNSFFLNNISKKVSLSSFFGCDTPELGKKIEENEVTHVLIFGWYLKSHWQAFFYCKRNKIPVAVRGDSQINPMEKIIKRVLKQLVYPLFIRKYDAILYVGSRNRNYLLKHGARENQLIFSPHAVDQSFWKNGKKRENKTYNKTRFVWVAKFIEKKHPFDVIHAFRSAYDINNDIELLMIGSGELINDAMELAKGCNAIQFLGFKNQTELQKIYFQSDCIILSSNYGETWGLVVNEAYATGIPAIVSDACGCSPDLLSGELSNLKYKFDSEEDLKQKIIIFSIQKNREIYYDRVKIINEEFSFHKANSGIRAFVNKF